MPNGELNVAQLRELGKSIEKYGDAGNEIPSSKGCGDITTRANIQLRGIPLEDAPEILDNMMALGITAKQSGGGFCRSYRPHAVLISALYGSP